MAAVARWVHLGAAWVFVGGVLLQGYLAGAALPELGGSSDFATHAFIGYTVMGLLALAVLVTSVLGRLPRRQMVLSLLLFVLYIVQTSLPNVRSDLPAIAALHPATAMVLLVLAGIIGWRARSQAARPGA